ncbi:MAG: glycosyltransferase family 39 protein [Candidatus Coatesbacteria bacterium]|nr:glycosyltransferase family 39 protein [Candidatus Coatesbacteria bacterium]
MKRKSLVRAHSSFALRASPFLLGAAILIMAFAFQGSRGIFSPDEGFYGSVAQSMLQTGDFLVPRLQQQPWLDKPPLSLWGIAAGMQVWGQNEMGLRAFHALCFVLTVLLVFVLGSSLGGKREGVLGAMIYATMAIPFSAANIVTPDTPLTLWTTAAFLCFWKSVKPDRRHPALWKMLLCAAMGLGFLTKGPAALVPAGAMIVFLLLERRTLRYLLTPWTVLGLALFAAIGLTWYAWIAREIPGALEYFLDNQVLGRTVSDKYARNPGLEGALIYLPVVLLGTLPWSLFWWRSLWRGWRGIFKRPIWISIYGDSTKLFLAVWIAVPLLVLSAASSRLPLYPLPVFPALALATARLLPGPASGSASSANPLALSRRMTLALALWMLALVGLKLAAAYCPSSQDMRALHGSIKKHLPAGPFEIVSVGEHLEALALYDAYFIEPVTTKATPYPFFVLPEHLDEEVAEIQFSDYSHVLICQNEDCARQVRNALRKASIPFEESALPFGRYLFVCPPVK